MGNISKLCNYTTNTVSNQNYKYSFVNLDNFIYKYWK